METTVIFEGEHRRGDLQNQVGLDVTHELLRNVLLNANARYTRDDFEGTSRTDNIFDAGAGVSYLDQPQSVRSTPPTASPPAIRTTTRSSSIRNIVLVGITAQALNQRPRRYSGGRAVPLLPIGDRSTNGAFGVTRGAGLPAAR